MIVTIQDRKSRDQAQVIDLFGHALEAEMKGTDIGYAVAADTYHRAATAAKAADMPTAVGSALKAAIRVAIARRESEAEISHLTLAADAWLEVARAAANDRGHLDPADCGPDQPSGALTGTAATE